MKAIRLITSVLFAAVTTVALVVVMFSLVDRDWEEPDERERRRIADFNMPDRNIETQYEEPRPERPDEPEPEPDIPQPDFQAQDVSADTLNIAAPRVEADFSGIQVGGIGQDGEYLPIVRVEPVYPSRAASRGIEGYVVVEFTVTTNGSVRDPMVVEAEPSTIFNRAAESAVLRWKFKPRVIDGVPVEVPGVQTQLTFRLDN